jgi:chemotaxis protein MotB
MARRKKEKAKEEPSAPLWMVTYSDMVTLLLCFFVMQLAFANFEEPGKVDAALESIQAAFGTGGQLMQSDATEKSEQNADMSESQHEALHVLVSTLRSVLAEMMSQNLVRMTTTKTEIKISMDETILFRPGSSKLNSSALALLGDIAVALGNQPISILVKGFADADGSTEEDNWSMSARRAVTVVTEMRRRTDKNGKPLLEGSQLEAHGLGQFRPADIAEDSAKWNRRVELVIKGGDTSAHGAINQLEQALEE